MLRPGACLSRSWTTTTTQGRPKAFSGEAENDEALGTLHESSTDRKPAESSA